MEALLADAEFVIMSVIWMFVQLIQIYCKNNAKLSIIIPHLIKQPLRKFVEQFEDGSILMLKSDIPIIDQILILLYHLYPKRVLRKNIYKALPGVSYKTISSTLSKLKKRRLIHENESGVILSRLGIERAENVLNKFGYHTN